MAEATNKPAKTPVLDLLHKGIYPVFGLAIASIVAWVHLGNAEKQRQIDRLGKQQETQAETIRQLQANSTAAEQAHHATRIIAWKAMLRWKANLSNSPQEEDGIQFSRTKMTLIMNRLKEIDVNRFGQTRAEELWEKAKAEAKKDIETDPLIF